MNNTNIPVNNSKSTLNYNSNNTSSNNNNYNSNNNNYNSNNTTSRPRANSNPKMIDGTNHVQFNLITQTVCNYSFLFLLSFLIYIDLSYNDVRIILQVIITIKFFKKYTFLCVKTKGKFIVFEKLDRKLL
jgi:hypothetical protein